MRGAGKSLLAAGITHLTGTFEPGDVLEIVTPDGRPLGRGLTNYSSTELATIQGRHSRDFADLLGRPAYDEVIHRDHLVLLP